MQPKRRPDQRGDSADGDLYGPSGDQPEEEAHEAVETAAHIERVHQQHDVIRQERQRHATAAKYEHQAQEKAQQRSYREEGIATDRRW